MEGDPYLEAMASFEVPAVDPAADAILEESGLLGELFGPDRYQSVSLVDYYGLHLAIALLERLEIAPHLSEFKSVPELLAARAFVPAFRAPLEWVLERLAAAGIVSRRACPDPLAYRVEAPIRGERTDWLWQQGMARDPDIAPTLELMRASADAYAAVARGELTGERFLATSYRLWAGFLDRRNWYYDLNNQVAARAAAIRLARSGVRALEMGAGLGSGTRALLDALDRRGTPAALASFRVTEPAPFFRRQLKRRILAEYPNQPLAFETFDINQSWKEQGCEAGRLDLLWAVNVLHLAKSLPATLAEAFDALAPGGWLILGEGLRGTPGQPLSIEIVFQLLKDYVSVERDAIRRTHGFISPEEWMESLVRGGFVDVQIVPDVLRLRPYCTRFSFGAVCGRKPGPA